VTLPPHVRAEAQRILDGELLDMLLVADGACFLWRWPLGNDWPVTRWNFPGRRPPQVWVRARFDHETRDFARYALALDPCAYCGREVQCIDHIRAAAHGGEDHWTNYVGACSSCNQSKGGKSLLRFLLDRTELVP
jgi:hypothetical protein